ncbi:hypothetical protein ACOME3_009093 [Neoechinorhynchus agilis]
MTSEKSNQIPIICHGHTRPITDLKFSGITDSSYILISGSKDGNPMIREGDTGDWIGTLVGHKGAIFGVAINKAGTMAATASADYTMKVWNVANGILVHDFEEQHVVKCVDISQSSKYAITGSAKNTIALYDIERGEVNSVYEQHSDKVNKVGFTSDKTFVSTSNDRTVNFCDVRVPTLVYSRLNLEQPAVGLEINLDYSYMTFVHGKCVSFIRNFCPHDLIRAEMECQMSSASIHPRQDRFVCGGADFKLYEYSIPQITEIASYRSHFGAIHCVQYSPDGALFASGSEDGTIRLFQEDVGKTYGLWSNSREPGISAQAIQ